MGSRSGEACVAFLQYASLDRRQRKPMPNQAKGTFSVRLDPLPLDHQENEVFMLARRRITKTFEGDLTAESRGEMLSAAGRVKGSAGYVALERVEGTLAGKRGAFVLKHDGTMNRGEPSLAVRVVPDSGTDELEGIRGQMRIDIVEGKHFYTFDYEV